MLSRYSFLGKSEQFCRRDRTKSQYAASIYFSAKPFVAAGVIILRRTQRQSRRPESLAVDVERAPSLGPHLGRRRLPVPPHHAGPIRLQRRYGLHDGDNMPQSRDEVSDALEKGLAGLETAATELGARALAVLVAEAATLELAYPRACVIECHPEIRCALTGGSSGESGPIRAGTSVACFLTSAIAPLAESFLLFPWRAPKFLKR